MVSEEEELAFVRQCNERIGKTLANVERYTDVELARKIVEMSDYFGGPEPAGTIATFAILVLELVDRQKRRTASKR